MNTIINDTIDAFEIFTEGNISLEEIQSALDEGEIVIDADLFNSLLETYLIEEILIENEDDVKSASKLKKVSNGISYALNGGMHAHQGAVIGGLAGGPVGAIAGGVGAGALGLGVGYVENMIKGNLTVL